MNKELNIQIPEGFEINESMSTFEKIVFKPTIKLPSAEERMLEIWRSCNNVKYSSDNCRTYLKDNEPIIQQDWNTKKLYYRYSLVYRIFKFEYNMKESDINNLVLKVVSKDLNCCGLAGRGSGWSQGLGSARMIC